MILILLGGTTTLFSLVKRIPNHAVAAIAALVTLLSAIQASQKPADRRHLQHQSSQELSELMLKMVRCETETEYEKLLEEYNKALSDDPLLAQKFKVKEDFNFSMIP